MIMEYVSGGELFDYIVKNGRLRPDEALLLKVFDQVSDGRAALTIHSAFTDPNTPKGASPRESLETRTFALF